MAVCCSSRPPTGPAAADQEEEAPTVSITTIHPDIIRAHILPRLDGPSLVAIACASAQLKKAVVSSDDTLWMDVCESTWPSTREPLVRQVVSTFPSGHRSLFSDSYPLMLHHLNPEYNWPSTTTSLISAVDIFYKDQLFFSEVQTMETESWWFQSLPLFVSLLDPEESVPTGLTINCGELDEDEWLKHLEENLTMSWIVIDPALKRAVNLMSRDAASVRRDWVTGDIQVKFGTVLASERRRGSEAGVVQLQFEATVTFGPGESDEEEGGGGGGGGGGEVVGDCEELTEVRLQVVEDMEGRILRGRDILAILRAAMEGGRRRNVEGTRRDAKERFQKFEEAKWKRKRRLPRPEDMAFALAWLALGLLSSILFW